MTTPRQVNAPNIYVVNKLSSDSRPITPVISLKENQAPWGDRPDFSRDRHVTGYRCTFEYGTSYKEEIEIVTPMFQWEKLIIANIFLGGNYSNRMHHATQLKIPVDKEGTHLDDMNNPNRFLEGKNSGYLEYHYTLEFGDPIKNIENSSNIIEADKAEFSEFIANQRIRKNLNQHQHKYVSYTAGTAFGSLSQQLELHQIILMLNKAYAEGKSVLIHQYRADVRVLGLTMIFFLMSKLIRFSDAYNMIQNAFEFSLLPEDVLGLLQHEKTKNRSNYHAIGDAAKKWCKKFAQDYQQADEIALQPNEDSIFLSFGFQAKSGDRSRSVNKNWLNMIMFLEAKDIVGYEPIVEDGLEQSVSVSKYFIKFTPDVLKQFREEINKLQTELPSQVAHQTQNAVSLAPQPQPQPQSQPQYQPQPQPQYQPQNQNPYGYYPFQQQQQQPQYGNPQQQGQQYGSGYVQQTPSPYQNYNMYGNSGNTMMQKLISLRIMYKPDDKSSTAVLGTISVSLSIRNTSEIKSGLILNSPEVQHFLRGRNDIPQNCTTVFFGDNGSRLDAMSGQQINDFLSQPNPNISVTFSPAAPQFRPTPAMY